MFSCFYCQATLPDRAIYCPNCAAQVRCKNKDCRDFLEPQARACISCGALQTELQASSVSDASAYKNSRFVNVLELKETITSRSVKLEFSDFAIDRSSEVIGKMIDSRNDLGVAKSNTKKLQENRKLLLGQTSEQKHLPGMGDENTNSEEILVDAEIVAESERINESGAGEDKSDSYTSRSPLKEQLKGLFYKNHENHWFLDDLNLKASGQKDAGRRVVLLLLLYTREIEGLSQIPRDEINTTLKDIGLYDPNIINWISSHPGLQAMTNNGQEEFRLRKAGSDEALEVLREMKDSSIKGTWEISDRSRTKTSKAITSETPSSTKANKPGRKSGNETIQWKTKWEELKLDIDGHSIAQNASMKDRGIFGLWAIYKATGGAVKVVSANKLADFIYKAFVVKSDVRSLGRALETKPEGKVLRVSGGYEVSPSGIKQAEQMANLQPNAQATASKKSSTKKSK